MTKSPLKKREVICDSLGAISISRNSRSHGYAKGSEGVVSQTRNATGGHGFHSQHKTEHQRPAIKHTLPKNSRSRHLPEENRIHAA